MTTHVRSRFVLIIAALFAAGVFVVGVGSCNRSPQAPPRLFYGRVIDQSGNPVPDAEIVVQLSQMQMNPIVPGGVVPDHLPQNQFSVRSDAAGSFVVTIPPPNHVVEIQSVKKDGYDWVIDWAWSLSVPPHNLGDNRQFILSGKLWKVPAYQPDQNRPAIFPLHRKDDPSPATQPSRGGSDLTREGKTVLNQPHPLKIPSAGPGAPTTPAEIEARIGEYINKLNASHRPSSTTLQ
jgi:hypothetical protein